MENEELVGVTESKTEYVKLEVKDISRSDVDIHYHTLPGNKPNSNKNYIGLWEASGGFIPLNEKAKWSYLVEEDGHKGNDTLVNLDLQDKEYILGYCQTGADPKTDGAAAANVSSTATIPKNISESESKTMSLSVSGTSSNLVLKYEILNGTKYDQHWIGIWEGDVPGAKNPIHAQKVTTDEAIKLKGVSFQRGKKYVLAYFANGFDAKSPDKSDIKNMVGTINFSFSATGE